ncbi:MAG: GatB/YqeY domain-containing protein [Candidatus Kerfeldbacteria bacterium]|nr:GatB/YqeY domain-containing protein [Candidatus Kerfeldbacteria bacterium]
MSLQQTIDADYKVAYKAKDAAAVSAYRMLKSAVKNREIDAGRELTDDETREVIAKEVKKRKDAMAQYQQGGRPELVDREELDIKLFSKYLPAQLTAAELEPIVAEAIAALGATGPADMGKVMGAVMAKTKGRTDGNTVQALVKKALGA